jgi:competence protein ComEC
LGEPVWWLAGTSLDLLLAIAHFTSAQPGAVKLMPQMGSANVVLFTLGGLWLALWSGRGRMLGLAPGAMASLMLLATPIPDVLIDRDGRHVGIVVEGQGGEKRLLSLRDTKSSYARDNLLELASVSSEPVPIAQWPDAQCSPQFCVVTTKRDGRTWSLLLARNRDLVEERALAAACERADIVVADRYLPRSCKPRWLKADRRLLDRSGGIALDLTRERVTTVAQSQGEHGWWRGAGEQTKVQRQPNQ